MYDYNPYRQAYNPYPQAQVNYPQTFPQRYPQQQMQMPVNNIVKGRVVTGIEEARAAQVDLDGTPSYFPSLGEGKIYVKYIGMDGLPVFQSFILEQPKPQMQGISLDSLAQRVQNIENAIQNMKGDAVNVQSNGNDANATV
ncbi:MAG: hypothetical protein ACI3WS_07510 [Phascolarctobacterium sp.]